MINISHGVCDLCLDQYDYSTRAKASTVTMTINNKQLEFCDEHFKEFVDTLSDYYKENFTD